MSIKKSLHTSILLIAIIPVFLMGISSYMVAITKYASVNEDSIKHLAYDYSRNFISQLDLQIVETERLADSLDVKKYLIEKVNTPEILLSSTSSYHDKANEALIEFSKNFNNHIDYYIYDIDGYLTISSNDQPSADWNEIMKNPIESIHKTEIIEISDFQDETLDIITPIIVKEQTIGLIRTNISIDYFKNTPDKNKDFLIITSKGKPLFDDKINNVHDKRLVTHILNLLKQHHELLTDNNNNQDNSHIFTDDDKYLYGYTLIKEYDWVYIVKQNTDSYVNIVSSLPIVFLTILTLVIILAFFISKNLTIKYTQPILALNEKMQNAAQGELNVKCEINTNDEFGELSNNFNEMMNIISTNYSDISKARRELESNQIELEENYKKIEKMAYTDPLTGLYNRMAFFKFSNNILAQNHSTINNHAVIFIDLDGFKSINDTLGHDYGDLLLKEIAKQLESKITSEDILARNGGDEFVIFKNKIESPEKLKEFLSDLVAIASHPFELLDETVFITISAGVALFPQDGLSLTELMKNSDIAMYTSKSLGKNSYTFFNSKMEDDINRRNDLIEILRKAINNHYVYLVYQPQANISTGKIIGCEALMRLHAPRVGFVSPDEFIPIAEECGLIDELGEWALIEASRFNQRLIDAGFESMQISVNISTTQLRGERLIEIIKSLPEKTSMSLNLLEIELTESVLMTKFNHNLSLINKMKDLGVKIALDDFGTGYSSFSYLTKLPINTLKIDKSFVAGICDNQNDSYISSTIINLSHQLGISVIAEGVETIEQLRILQSQSCDTLQGYFFSKPITEDEFIELLKINSIEN